MPMSSYYQELRQKIGTDLIFSPAVAAVIRNDIGEVLFVKSREDHLWSIPAGAIEIGETPAQAIRREVWEETGLTVRPLRILGVAGGRDFRWTYPDGNQVEYLTIVFECQIESGELTAMDGSFATVILPICRRNNFRIRRPGSNRIMRVLRGSMAPHDLLPWRRR